MARDLWEQVQQLFDAALQQPPEKRQEFLEQACGSKQELRREVESLLAAHDKPGSFMAEPALAGMAEVLHRATSRFRPGDTLGVYKVLDLVGSGGMGEVYRAQDMRLKREVAIKVLPQAFAADRERVRRFEQEARSAAALNHPNIVSVHDTGTADGSPYIVSELLDGQNLGDVLRQGRVPARKALDYAIQAARGLAAAHDADIIHRDLKPENLFITQDGQLKILDFGLAKLTQPDELGLEIGSGEARPQTEAGRVLGTIGYMSPEQVRRQAADHRSDIFSFGCILYELFSGQRAFGGDSPADTMSAILREDPPELQLSSRPALLPNPPASVSRWKRLQVACSNWRVHGGQLRQWAGVSGIEKSPLVALLSPTILRSGARWPGADGRHKRQNPMRIPTSSKPHHAHRSHRRSGDRAQASVTWAF